MGVHYMLGGGFGPRGEPGEQGQRGQQVNTKHLYNSLKLIILLLFRDHLEKMAVLVEASMKTRSEISAIIS